jgi:catechol 2,3-dioxygenase-like lactoylglutathione lyase family enzyme
MAGGRIALDHVVLEVRDPEASADFYRRLLGLAPVRLAGYRSGSAPFLSARVTPETLVDFFPRKLWRDRKRAQNPNHICFTLSAQGVRTVRRRLARMGVPIDRESGRNYGARGWGVSLYVYDPDRISVEVRYYAPRPGKPASGRSRSARPAHPLSRRPT